MKNAAAIFADRKAAEAAYDELLKTGDIDNMSGISVHEGELDETQLPVAQTDARRSAVLGGIAVGSATAILVTAVVYYMGASVESFGLALLFGVVLVAWYGWIAGALAGATQPSRDIEGLDPQLKRGQVAIVVQPTDETQRKRVIDVLETHGGVLHGEFARGAA